MGALLTRPFGASHATMHVDSKEETHKAEEDVQTLNETDEVDDNDEDEDEDIYGPFEAIPDDKFSKLVFRLLNAASYMVVKRTQGSYHYVVILSNMSQKVVVKVPIIGTQQRWDRRHATIMQSEADTMTLIKLKLPDFPIPAVLGHDGSFDNEICAPFTLMSFVEGKPSNHVWFDEDADDEDDEANVNSPSEEREKMRITFLQSLAKTMAQLRNLEFDGSGMVFLKNGNPDKPVIGPYMGWDSRSLDDIIRVYWERPVFKAAAASYTERLEHHIEKNSKNIYIVGINTILSHVYSSWPFVVSKKSEDEEKESFTLFHNDLDFQNILVNDSGEATGILDWDGCGTSPRCAGFATVPLFLQRDWENNYDFTDDGTMAPWGLDKYRGIYANAMIDACGGLDTDAEYTKNSAIYGVAHDVLFGDNATTIARTEDFIRRLLREIPLLRQTKNTKKFTKQIGGGWEQAEDILKEGVRRLLWSGS